jgi:outer membrane receptor protein involved in Fe transport
MTTKDQVLSRHAAKFQVTAKSAPGGRSGSRYLVHATIAAVLAAAMYQTAQAQETPEAQASPLEEVVVTGSRIQRSKDLESSSPLVTVSSDVLTNISTVGVENALNQLPQFIPAQTQFVNSDNSPSATDVPGAATINLRGLGTNRTLVLLDGRRAQPSSVALVVDVNSIPEAAIDHVEVVTGGASAVYGADAIAGVVNFRLKNHFQGAELDAQTGITQQGDGMESRLSATLGTDFAEHRGNILTILEWAKRDAVYQSNRSFFSDSWTDPFSNSAMAQLFSFNDYNPAGNLPTSAAVNSIFGNIGVPTTTAFWFNTDQTLFKNSFVAGNPAASTAGFDSALPANTSRQGNQNNILNQHFADSYVSSPMTRYSMFTKVNYNLTDSITAFFQGNFSENNVSSLTLATPSRSSWVVTLPYCSDQTLAAGTNPTCAATRASHPVPTQLATLLDSRASRDAPWTLESTLFYLGPRIADITTNVFQVMAGLDGALPVKDWTWEAYVSHGETSIDDNMESGFASVQRYGNILNAPSNGTNLNLGGYGAGYTSSGLSAGLGAQVNCTSGLPVFSAASFTPSKDCVNAIGLEPNTRTHIQQDVVEVTSQGGIFNLPAGELRGSLGLDWRRDYGVFSPDPDLDSNSVYETVAGNFTTAGAQGATEVKEVYGELLVPVLKDLPAIKSLNLELGDRFSEYNTAGNTSTWKALLNWAPVSFLTFRGGLQYAVRAPNIAELYIGNSEAAVTFPYGDPCAGANTTAPWGNVASNPNRAKVQALCGSIIGKFDPTSPYFVNPSTYPGGSGSFLASENEIITGNANLKPETAHTVTVGTVFRSPFDNPALRSLTATVDYYKINMTDTIGVIDSVTVYQNCFNYNGVSNPNYDPNNSFCQLIGRQTTNGGRAFTTALYSNLGTLNTSGLDYTFNWRAALQDMFGHGLPGTLGFHVSGTWLMSYKQQTAPSAAIVQLAGTGSTTGTSYYSYRTFSGLSYEVGPASVEVDWTHLPTIENVIQASQPNTTVQPTRQYNLFNLSAGWEFNQNLSMRFGVDNLFDRQAPVVGAQPGVTDGAGSTNASIYDVLGRRFYLSVKAKL